MTGSVSNSHVWSYLINEPIDLDLGTFEPVLIMFFFVAGEQYLFIEIDHENVNVRRSCYLSCGNT